MLEKKCVICGRIMLVKPCRFTRAKCCSKKCLGQYNGQLLSGKARSSEGTRKTRIALTKRAIARYGPIFDLKCEELQYLAGLIDAKGTVHIDPHYQRYHVSICNSDRHCLEWVLNTVHFGKIYSRGTKRQNHFGSKEIFVWYCAVSDFTKRLLMLLIPYLRVKRSKSLDVLQLQNVPVELMSWPYIAAFFDGEGSASFYEKQGLWIVSFSNSVLSVLEEVREFMGFGQIYSIPGTKKAMWCLRLSRHDVQAKFGEAVLPFLMIKKEKIRGMLGFIKSKEWFADDKLRNVPDDDLRHKYLEEKKSIRQLAAEYNVRYNPMREHLLKRGISLRSVQEGIQLRHSARCNFPKESVLSRYNDGESARRLAKELGIDHHTLCKWLRDNGVKIRPKLWKLHNVSSKELLVRYHDGWSVRQLAEQYKVSSQAMYQCLSKLGVVFSPEQRTTEDLARTIES